MITYQTFLGMGGVKGGGDLIVSDRVSNWNDNSGCNKLIGENGLFKFA
jgi:hypothetical protein